MEGLSRATGSSIVLEVGNRTYSYHGITLADYGAMEAHILSKRTNPLEEVAKVYSFLPETVGNSLIERAYNDTRKSNVVTAEELSAWSNTTEGLIFNTWLSLRHDQPNITLREVDEFMQALALHEVKKINQTIQQAGGTDTRGNSTGQDGAQNVPTADQGRPGEESSGQ